MLDSRVFDSELPANSLLRLAGYSENAVACRFQFETESIGFAPDGRDAPFQLGIAKPDTLLRCKNQLDHFRSSSSFAPARICSCDTANACSLRIVSPRKRVSNSDLPSFIDIGPALGAGSEDQHSTRLDVRTYGRWNRTLALHLRGPDQLRVESRRAV